MDADRVKPSLISRTSEFIVALASVLLFVSSLLAQTDIAQIEELVDAAEQQSPLERKTAKAARSTRLDWWNKEVVQSVTESDRWVSFDLETILLDTLENSPRIESVSKRTSIAFEQIVQQDAMFDPNVLFESKVGRNNEPIGNELTTGGPPRLIEGSTLARAGVQKNGRRGTLLDLSQEVGTFNSNSKFVSPVDQGNARLAVSLTQPLLGRGGMVYNERFVTQASLDSRISWQEMRSEVEGRISEVITGYWRLYELRCHLLQQTELLQRGEHIQQVVLARRDFDTGRVELAKTRQRVARRIDRLLQIEAGIARQQARLARLIGSELLQGESGGIEFVPNESPEFPRLDVNLADAVLKGIENRPEVRAAVSDLESAGLAVNVTRAELDPQLSAIVAGYVSGLDGNYGVFDAWTNQFTRGGPGISAAVKYQMPYGRRAAKARYREAQLRYQQRNQQLREAMQLTTADIEIALIDVNTALAQQSTKKQLLVTAIEEESILTKRWEMMGDEGGLLGVVLENLLDAQQRRTEAEREWSSAQIRYLTSIVGLQKAMGTLLVHEGIRPIKYGRCDIQFVQDIVVQDQEAFSSPSDITPAVEAEIDASIEADVTPDLERSGDENRGQDSSALPIRIPFDDEKTEAMVRRLPSMNGLLRPQRLLDSRLRRLPGLPSQQESRVSEIQPTAISPLRLPKLHEGRSVQRLPIIGPEPTATFDPKAVAPRATLSLPTAPRAKVIRLPRGDHAPAVSFGPLVPVSTQHVKSEAYPRRQSSKPQRLPDLNLEIQP
jgi:outer membrane protein TolC